MALNGTCLQISALSVVPIPAPRHRCLPSPTIAGQQIKANLTESNLDPPSGGLASTGPSITMTLPLGETSNPSSAAADATYTKSQLLMPKSVRIPDHPESSISQEVKSKLLRGHWPASSSSLEPSEKRRWNLGQAVNQSPDRLAIMRPLAQPDWPVDDAPKNPRPEKIPHLGNEGSDEDDISKSAEDRFSNSAMENYSLAEAIKINPQLSNAIHRLHHFLQNRPPVTPASSPCPKPASVPPPTPPRYTHPQWTEHPRYDDRTVRRIGSASLAPNGEAYITGLGSKEHEQEIQEMEGFRINTELPTVPKRVLSQANQLPSAETSDLLYFADKQIDKLANFTLSAEPVRCQLNGAAITLAGDPKIGTQSFKGIDVFAKFFILSQTSGKFSNVVDVTH
ncbi:unnamed protein product [Protopolystoma xenopodis]|uniref:Uncharacterized protein n=1 Tax=Protopolystoma xenopodis TaxID=117903 RepID=A0A448WCR1_9PLAT|nr:unnamed protein product [Protopolystoma xenopodis]